MCKSGRVFEKSHHIYVYIDRAGWRVLFVGGHFFCENSLKQCVLVMRRDLTKK